MARRKKDENELPALDVENLSDEALHKQTSIKADALFLEKITTPDAPIPKRKRATKFIDSGQMIVGFSIFVVIFFIVGSLWQLTQIALNIFLPSPPRIQLKFDDDTLHMANLSFRNADLTRLDFISIDVNGDPTTSRVSLTDLDMLVPETLEENHCLSIEIRNNQRLLIEYGACDEIRIGQSTAVDDANLDAFFWQSPTHDGFVVFYDDAEIGDCVIRDTAGKYLTCIIQL